MAPTLHRRACLLGAAAALLASAQAQPAWPNRPVKLVVPYAAGGPADVVARELAQRLSADTGQPFLVDNQGGGLGLPALNTVSRAEPDGHTLYMPALGNVVLQPLLSKNAGAEQLAKLQPVSMVSTGAHVLVVSAKLPVTSVKELVELARAKPGQVSFASAGTGGTAHLAMEMFKALSKTEVLHVPYKGSSAAFNDLASGQVSAMFSSLPSMQGLVDKGLVRVIAATAASRSSATRSLPLMSAALPGFDYTTWYAMYAPGGTPAALVERINALLRKALQDPAVAARIEPHGTELLGSSPDEVAQWVKRDTEKWSRVIREAGIRIE
ncbi:MAG: tripartite tricarboxylate transporter substrate binding protein [Rubrivivax sp.]